MSLKYIKTKFNTLLLGCTLTVQTLSQKRPKNHFIFWPTVSLNILLPQLPWKIQNGRLKSVQMNNNDPRCYLSWQPHMTNNVSCSKVFYRVNFSFDWRQTRAANLICKIKRNYDEQLGSLTFLCFFQKPANIVIFVSYRESCIIIFFQEKWKLSDRKVKRRHPAPPRWRANTKARHLLWRIFVAGE